MTETLSTVEYEIAEYLTKVMTELAAEAEPPAAPAEYDEALAAEIFNLVTSRKFCYLQRTRTEPYRDATMPLLRRRLAAHEALRFFYDIGPGYHASLRPGRDALVFDVGFSELLILFQISSLSRRIAALYPPGVEFWLVVDNLCGHKTNDIPLELTEGYCARLRALIAEVGLTDRVHLIVESEEFALDEYNRLFAELEPRTPTDLPSEDAIDNVARFLGRECSVEEAAERIERYERATAVTDRLVDELVQGVHMTQRATGATLGFRPFPGGDSRTQCGQVALGENEKGQLRPFLLTNKNVARYGCTNLAYPDLLPASVRHVIHASPAEA